MTIRMRGFSAGACKKEAMKQASAQKVLNPKGDRRRSMHQAFINKYGLDQ